jgi:hypothetical protein
MVEVTIYTWIVAVLGLVIMGILIAAQSIALVKPRGEWTIKNIYGGSPDTTDPTAYFAFNQGYAWADTLFWGPFQIAGSIGMLLGHRWGFIAGLIGSVPFWYSAIPLFIWDRDMGYRQNTVQYWVVWGMFPAYGILEMLYCSARLLAV